MSSNLQIEKGNDSLSHTWKIYDNLTMSSNLQIEKGNFRPDEGLCVEKKLKNSNNGLPNTGRIAILELSQAKNLIFINTINIL